MWRAMLGLGIAASTLGCAGDGSGVDCGPSAHDAGPPPRFVPDPACGPLLANEACSAIGYRDEQCGGAGRAPCELQCTRETPALLVPWSVTLSDDGSIAYIEFMRLGETPDNHEQCPELVRYRVGLTDGAVAHVGSTCVAPEQLAMLLDEIERSSGFPGYMLCELSDASDLEIRVVAAQLQDCGMLSCTEYRTGEPAVFVRRHGTGELIMTHRLAVPLFDAGLHRVVLPTSARTDLCCLDATGCAAMCDFTMSTEGCGGSGYVLRESAGEDGLCYVQFAPP